MNDLAASVEVQVTARTAYEQWTRIESFPAFMPGVLAVEQLSLRTSHWVTEVAGAHREFDAEIVDQRPGECIAWRSTGGDFSHHGAVTFHSISAEETRVVVDMAWEPQRLAERVASTFGLDRLQLKTDLLRFKRFIEARPASASRSGPASAKPPAEAKPYGAASAEPPAEARRNGPAGTEAPAEATGPQASVPRALAGGRPLAHDVVDVLRTQHQQVRRMLALTDAMTGAAKEQHFRQLTDLLETHERGEQEVVRPVTRTCAGGERTAANRLDEEREADELIARLKQTAVDTPEFDRLLDRLRDMVLMHAEQEEMEEFPMLRDQIAADRLWDMADELLAAQARHRD
jgi:hypothetical protein